MAELLTYRRDPHSLKMSVDGKILVQPGDWLSKYSWVFYGDYTSLDHFEQYDEENDTGLTIVNKDLIKTGETILWVPWFYEYRKKNPNTRPARPRRQFDRQATVAYAQRWATSHNPRYEMAPVSDAANFVSQALFAGGWPLVNQAKDGSDCRDRAAWWYDRRGRRGMHFSMTWINDKYFHDYLGLDRAVTHFEQSVRSRHAIPRLAVGDVIQGTDHDYHWHTMIVTQVGTSGARVSPADVRVCYHHNGAFPVGLDTNELDVPLSKFHTQEAFRTLHYWHLPDTIVT